ncbi:MULTISPECIES: hypothetical protein [Bacillus cereus group]|uniref:Lipoprotein n=1 Tax=Bacillus cereus VD118 TaxID=1053231 RepID=R8Q9G9_BACCE|nr:MULTISPECIES: hypothetical protein [Bacillus cereus group]EOP67397.1 hypothetical protein IIQ_05350 [Bacillus cereus VD118]MBJ8095380.1 hypothetical protein [Bacillus cereus]MCQ6359515.1 hypothetical protein [Bacillus cereus]CAH2464438.1 hypothetical protein ACOSJ1_EBGNOMHC_04972 [Bacillus mycoides KBAB4]
MYKRLGTIAFTGALSFSLAACGSNEKTSNGVETKEKEQTKQETKKDNSKEEKAESAKGNRTNPIAFNETASIDDVILNTDGGEFKKFKAKVEVSILEVIRGEQAFAILKQENQFNKPAPEGKEWVLVKVKGKVVDAETQDFEYLLSDMNFKLVSKEGQVYNHELSAVAPNQLHQKLYKGAEGEGYISQVVNTGDDFMIQFETHKLAKVFFKSK